MDKKHFIKIAKNIKRRSYVIKDSKDFINDLLENKITENQLLNYCISGNIPEKARTLVWKILLNLIPLNKANEWSFYFEKYAEIYIKKLNKYLSIKNENGIMENYDYEFIEKNMRIVNNENIENANFNNTKNHNDLAPIMYASREKPMANRIIEAINNKINENFKNQNSIPAITNVKFKNDLRVTESNHDLNGDHDNEAFSRSDNIIINNNPMEINGSNLVQHNLGLHEVKAEIFNKTSNSLGININKNKNKCLHRNSLKNYYSFYTENQKLSIDNIEEKNQRISEATDIIKLDVERTYQEIDLFKSVETKEILCKILYLWYIENSDLGYKQGMNEILATVFYASFNINDSHLQSEEHVKYNKHHKFFELLEIECNFQTDLYILFDQIMSLGLKSVYSYHTIVDNKLFSYVNEKSKFFRIQERNFTNEKNSNEHEFGFSIIYKSEIFLDLEDDKKNNKLKTEQIPKINYKIFENENMDKYSLIDILNLEQSDLRRRVNITFYYYLKTFDPELYYHLLNKIDPYIVIFRWILCLFNREISIQNVLYLWDCIFAIEFLEKNSSAFLNSFKNTEYRNVINTFNFINFICVSIFEDIRKEILEEDDSCYILQMLMHFPNEKNVKELVKRALKIRKFVYEQLNITNEYVFIELNF